MTGTPVDDLFAELDEAMRQADTKRIGATVQTPGFGVRDGVVFAFTSGDDVERHAEALVERYRGAGIRTVTEETTGVEWLGTWAAFVNRRFHAVREDGSIANEVMTTYLVLSNTDGMRVVAYVNHDGSPAGGSVERDAEDLAEAVREAFARRAAGAVASLARLPAYGVQDGLLFAVNDETMAREQAFAVIAHFAGMGMARVRTRPVLTEALGAWCARTTHAWTIENDTGAVLQELTLTFLVVREAGRPVVLAYVAHD